MRRVLLERLQSDDYGTFGRIIADSLTLFTCELPWRDNAPNISCIPVGLYRALWVWSNRFRCMTYLLYSVPGRTGIRLHPANMPSQLNGCIALGEKLGTIDDKPAVLLSRPAMRRFEELMGYKPFELEVA